MREWILPCHKVAFDIEAAFAESKTIQYKNESGVQQGDVVYVLLDDSVRYKCTVSSVSSGQQSLAALDSAEQGLASGKRMQLTLEAEFPAGKFPAEELKKRGMSALQKTTEASSAVSDYLNGREKTGDKKLGKQNLTILIIILIVAIFLITVVAIYITSRSGVKSGAAQKTPQIAETAPTKTYTLETLVHEISANIVLSAGGTKELRYPHIDLDSNDIKGINEYISSECQEAGADRECLGIDYACYLNGNILSVVISEKFMNKYHEFMIVNVNVEEERWASKAELLQACGYQTKNERDEALAATLTECLEESYRDDCTRTGSAYDESYIAEYVEQTTAQKNLKSASYYLNANGQACAASTYYYPAGNGRINGCFNLVSHEFIKDLW